VEAGEYAVGTWPSGEANPSKRKEMKKEPSYEELGFKSSGQHRVVHKVRQVAV
jgi:hypothetical protein